MTAPAFLGPALADTPWGLIAPGVWRRYYANNGRCPARYCATIHPDTIRLDRITERTTEVMGIEGSSLLAVTETLAVETEWWDRTGGDDAFDQALIDSFFGT